MSTRSWLQHNLLLLRLHIPSSLVVHSYQLTRRCIEVIWRCSVSLHGHKIIPRTAASQLWYNEPLQPLRLPLQHPLTTKLMVVTWCCSFPARPQGYTENYCLPSLIEWASTATSSTTSTSSYHSANGGYLMSFCFPARRHDCTETYCLSALIKRTTSITSYPPSTFPYLTTTKLCDIALFPCTATRLYRKLLPPSSCKISLPYGLRKLLMLPCSPARLQVYTKNYCLPAVIKKYCILFLHIYDTPFLHDACN